MVNPLEQPLPDNKMERTRHFARDLAYGAIEELWELGIQTEGHHKRIKPSGNPVKLYEYLNQKWGNSPPPLRLLIVLKYLAESNENALHMTDKAYALLEDPLQSVFISYHRATSSALSMFIWSELLRHKYDCFIDVHNLNPGDPWHHYLEEAVRRSSVFLSVLGRASLHSDYVKKELEWALDEGSKIIPVLHDGLEIDDLSNTIFEALRGKDAIIIANDVSADFAAALSKLLKTLDIFEDS